jgi:hypothetical protein
MHFTAFFISSKFISGFEVTVPHNNTGTPFVLVVIFGSHVFCYGIPQLDKMCFPCGFNLNS